MLTGNLKPTVDEKHLLHCSSYAVKCLTLFFQKGAAKIFETRVRSVVERANSRRAPTNVYTHFTASVEKSACWAARVVVLGSPVGRRRPPHSERIRNALCTILHRVASLVSLLLPPSTRQRTPPYVNALCRYKNRDKIK